MDLQRSTLFLKKIWELIDLNIFLNEVVAKISGYLNLQTFQKTGIVIIEVGFLILMLACYNSLTSPYIQATETVALLYERSYPIIINPSMGFVTMMFGILIVVLDSDEVVSGYFE